MSLPINDDLRQHISLSTFAYNTIMSDLMTYDNTTLKASTLSGIANIIIRNSFDRSFASINKNAESEKLELDALILKNFKLDSKEAEVANTLRDSLIEKHREDLALKMNNFSKDHNIKIRLQKDTVRLLENECTDDIEYYKKSLTGYLKALLEDYARQNKYNRESILFKDTIEKLEAEIDRADYLGGKSRALKLTCANYYGNKMLGEYICKPYRITYENEVDDFPYLLCLCVDPKLPNDGYIETLLPIFEMLNIEYAPKKYGSSNLTKDNKKKMDQLVAEHNSYLFGKRKQKILVSFSEEGLYSFYHKNTKERPSIDIKKIRKNGNHRYEIEFFCTQTQAYDYLLPFGGDALVLSPQELSKEIAEYHRRANYVYSLQANKQGAPKPNATVEKDIKLLQDADSTDYYAKTWNDLATKYFDMTSNLKDVEAEFLFYKRVADLEYEEAYPMLGDIYFENNFFKNDYKKAAYYYGLSFNELDPYRKANYASLIINNLAEGHNPKEGYAILESLKDRFHKDHIQWITPEGYTFYSYEYKKYDRANIWCYMCPDGRPFEGKDSEWSALWDDAEDK